MEENLEKEVKEKLKKYSPQSIKFLKKKWNSLISQRKFSVLEKLKGANPQIVYNILIEEKIKSIRKAKYHKNRYIIILKYSKRYEVDVIVIFEIPKKGDIGIVTYYKREIKSSRRQ